MEFKLLRPKNQLLSNHIEYFLFIQSTPKQEIDAYTTIPNTNTCLSLYRNNEVRWDRQQNNCLISESVEFGVSKLYGWHQRPFNVSISGQMDQVCIVFKPLGLANFTSIPLNALDVQGDPFKDVFGSGAKRTKHQLFETENLEDRAMILENLLVNHLRIQEMSIVDICLQQIVYEKEDAPFSIHGFSAAHNINESTLYRNFQAKVGESVKKFQLKHKFRNFLKRYKSAASLTQLSYVLNYSDQSHLVKEVKKYTGYSPRKLNCKLKTVEGELLLLHHSPF